MPQIPKTNDGIFIGIHDLMCLEDRVNFHFSHRNLVILHVVIHDFFAEHFILYLLDVIRGDTTN